METAMTSKSKKYKAQAFTIEVLRDYQIAFIFCHLPLKDVVYSCGLVCKRWNRICIALLEKQKVDLLRLLQRNLHKGIIQAHSLGRREKENIFRRALNNQMNLEFNVRFDVNFLTADADSEVLPDEDWRKNTKDLGQFGLIYIPLLNVR